MNEDLQRRVQDLERENANLRAQVEAASTYARYFAICKIRDEAPLSFDRWYYQKRGTGMKMAVQP